jgi:hypothetical protein
MNDLTTINQKIEAGNIDIQALSQTEAFKQFCELTKAVDATWEAIKAHVSEQGEIKGAWGAVGISERKNWKVSGVLDDSFYKKSLDTTKLNNMFKANVDFPQNVDFTVTRVISKRLK